ncbi:carboxymuconolactone decarboxylase family protein [Rufibacter hautae]|uniref:Carboxymuconolactone decarboxylase n=1 Tax=Rufibacter hautae TaxID=2595005 RepID=A0A5B6TA77_9BACT|nr:carboxymuconolactone decarboxylase family protein [Rufibacter hautae]KAA3437096.1 carboxymuconolactone decarboxylase [Rufibacter hautae]
MKKLRFYFLPFYAALVFCLPVSLYAQSRPQGTETLDARQRHIVTISSFTAKGDLARLGTALNAGLDAGLTINETKEVLIHLYAYCGFPRSLQGINTLMAVLEKRKAEGTIDKVGREATLAVIGENRYEKGKKVLEALTGQPEKEPKTGYAAFSPEIEVFLKEHLFADLFGRGILSYQDREIATISALINLGGVEPMMRSHMAIALNLDITESQLRHLLSLVESNVGKKEAESGRQVLAALLASRKK